MAPAPPPDEPRHEGRDEPDAWRPSGAPGSGPAGQAGQTGPAGQAGSGAGPFTAGGDPFGRPGADATGSDPASPFGTPPGATPSGSRPMGSGPPGPPPPGSGPGGYGAPAYGPPAYGPPGSAPPGAGPPGSGPPGTPPGYGYGYGYGYGSYPPPTSNNGLAVASIICGVLGLFFCQLIGIAAIITGYIARRRIRETGEQGAGLALAGIILGWISVAITVAVILFYVAFGIFAVSTASNSSSSTFPRTPTTRRGAVTSTTERIAPTTSTRPPGPTAAPSGVIPVEACPAVTLALKNLEDPAKADRGILTDAARTLHERYPAEAGDDIDTLLADALSRVDRDTTGAKTTPVLEASQRLDDILAAACPG